MHTNLVNEGKLWSGKLLLCFSILASCHAATCTVAALCWQLRLSVSVSETSLPILPVWPITITSAQLHAALAYICITHTGLWSKICKLCKTRAWCSFPKAQISCIWGSKFSAVEMTAGTLVLAAAKDVCSAHIPCWDGKYTALSHSTRVHRSSAVILKHKFQYGEFNNLCGGIYDSIQILLLMLRHWKFGLAQYPQAIIK